MLLACFLFLTWSFPIPRMGETLLRCTYDFWCGAAYGMALLDYNFLYTVLGLAFLACWLWFLLTFARILSCDASRYVSYTLSLFHIRMEHCLQQDMLFDYIVSISDRLYISIRFDFVYLLSASLYYWLDRRIYLLNYVWIHSLFIIHCRRGLLSGIMKLTCYSFTLSFNYGLNPVCNDSSFSFLVTFINPPVINVFRWQISWIATSV